MGTEDASRKALDEYRRFGVECNAWLALSPRLRNLIRRELGWIGYDRAEWACLQEQLPRLTDDELLAWRNFGERSLREWRARFPDPEGKHDYADY